MSPYLSIIATSRNDNHGGNLSKRMNLFVKSVLYQTRRVQLPTELVIVEWNPPKGEPLLHEILPKPQEEDYLSIRYIIVPNEIHRRYKRGDVLPLFQMIGKNVGIRRARGEFVLCTNVDIIFSNEIFDFLAKRSLRSDSFYRANRADISDGLSQDWNMKQVLNFCKHHVMDVLGKNPSYTNLGNTPSFLYRFGFVLKTWNKIVGSIRKRRNERAFKLFELDTKACGDFTLLSKAAWLDIQGYPEFDLYSIHVDSMGLMAATALDYKQVTLSPEKRIYHIHHQDGWEAFNVISVLKFLEKIPGLDWNLVWNAGTYIIENKTRFNINDENWGFADKTLEEFHFEPEKIPSTI